MAAYTDYTSLDVIKQELSATNVVVANSGDLDARITRIITAASRAIDHWCKAPDGYFAGQAQVRFFDIPPTLNGPERWMRDVGMGEGGGFAEFGGPTMTVMGIATGEVPRLSFDVPLIGPTEEVAVDQTLDGTYTGIMTYLKDYDLFPPNAQLDGRPFIEIRWLPATATVSFPIGQRTLRIKGLWGYTLPPVTQQTLQLTGAPTGGTFTLSYQGQTTSPIAFNASGDDVSKALLALSTISNLTGYYVGTSQLTVSDGMLPSDTLTISMPRYFSGLTGASSLTGGTAPGVSLSSTFYTGPTCPADLQQACIFQTIKWLKEIEAAPMGLAGSPELGFSKVGPSDAVLEILEDGNYMGSAAWGFV